MYRNQRGVKDQDAGSGALAASVWELAEAHRRSEKERVTSTGMNLQTGRRTRVIEEVAWSMRRNFIGGVPV